MSRFSRFLPTVVVFTCLAVSNAFAQQGSAVTGSLAGSVTDSSGALISGADITVIGPQGQRNAKSDALGRYAIDNLIPGFYDVTVEAPGFKKTESKHNEVVVNVASSLNLKLAVGSTAELVEVNASAIAINTESNAIDANLTDTFYNSVPMARNVASLFYVAPGVVSGLESSAAIVPGVGVNGPGASNPSIGGATGLENLYVVDGVTITDQAFGSLGTYNRYHGALGSGVNLAFIKEVDIKGGGFEPQYGKAQGGIVQIVTKSGSNALHGAVAAYLGPGKWYADRYQFHQFGFVQTLPGSSFSNPQYDASAELGGYIPHLQNRMFFFGAMNPGLSQYINEANPAAPLFPHGPYAFSTTVFNWAGKLTYKMGDSSQIEGSSFGDPSRHNQVPNSLSAANAASVTSAYNYGSIDSVLRLNTAFSPTLLFTASYTYNHNHFTEIPSQNFYQVSDQSGLSLPTVIPTTVTGFGAYEPSVNNTYSLAVGTQKIVQFHGSHTFTIGYSYDHTNFLDKPSRSGPLFAIPSANALGVDLSTLFSNIPARAPGSMTNALFQLAAANSSNYQDTTCTQCPTYRGEKVYLTQTRGTYVGLSVLANGIYHTAYANDNWQINRYISVLAGVRFEQQRTAGTILSYVFTGNWSPRLGINIDPFGDRKTKVFFNYGNYVWAMPLDAAIRQLGNEQDDTSYAFAPEADSAGNMVIGPNGGPVPILDSAHVLNGLPRRTVNGTVSKFGGPSFASSTGEGILPGTKSEYETEYLIGVERELTPGLVVKARYTDRRLQRVIEDIGSQSPEGSTIGSNYNGGIANPRASTDLWTNEAEITYTADQYNAANPPGSTTYTPPVPGCTSKNDTAGAIGGNVFTNALNQPIGGACFTNLSTMDNPPPDGKPDGFVDPVRRYQALELELNRRFTNHWMAVVNYRYAKLWGNYEGAYRNDNGQSDPGISSLFDFTAGSLGLLGDQFRPGYLNTDKRNVGNAFLSYNIGSGQRFVGIAHGLTVGLGARGQSGSPLSKYGDHPIYFSQGEIPFGGRGTAGRLPSTMQLDLHADYPINFKEKYTVKLAFDSFNVTNSQFITSKVQFLQQPAGQVGVAPPANLDFGRPSAFQGPFYARGSIRFEF